MAYMPWGAVREPSMNRASWWCRRISVVPGGSFHVVLLLRWRRGGEASAGLAGRSRRALLVCYIVAVRRPLARAHCREERRREANRPNSSRGRAVLILRLIAVVMSFFCSFRVGITEAEEHAVPKESFVVGSVASHDCKRWNEFLRQCCD